jgi:hypothetical protein
LRKKRKKEMKSMLKERQRGRRKKISKIFVNIFVNISGQTHRSAPTSRLFFNFGNMYKAIFKIQNSNIDFSE